LQLQDASIASYFLDTFGRPERILTCACERSDEPSMTQVLHLANGKTLLEKLEAKDGRIAKWVEDKATPDQVIDQLYLTALSRLPTENEQARLRAVLTETPESERRAALEDVMWSVLTSREFLFQH